MKFTAEILLILLTVLSFNRALKTEKFRFANYYGDHMVLQRSPYSPTVWGYIPDCEGSVTVTIISTKTTATIERILGETFCRWKVKLPATPAGGPHVITAQTTTPDGVLSISLKDVLFGDVWMCGGQSNMAFALMDVFNASEEIKAASNYSNIRLMQIHVGGSNNTLEEPAVIQPPWRVASSTTVSTFSAVCWFYGRDIYDIYSVPMGLISSNWGGTDIQVWSSPDVIKKCPNVSTNIGSQIKAIRPTTPSVLWNSMIFPFLKMSIYGAIWYQGESNAQTNETAEQYKCLFPAMINDWREKWYFYSDQQTKQDFPFGFVQLAANGEDNKTQGFFPELRWSQTAGFGYVPNDKLQNVFMAVAMDLGDPASPRGSIHPRDKQDVGIRLATAGRAIAYGDANIYYQGPIPYHITNYRTENGIYGQVFFKNIDDTLYMVSQYGFELACVSNSTTKSETWIEGIAKGTTNNGVVSILFPRCPEGYKEVNRMRYAWRENPCPFKQCSIYSGKDYRLPAPPFIFTEE